MIRISRQDRDTLMQLCAQADPFECCGLFSGDGTEVKALYPSENISMGDRTKTFEVDPLVRFQVIRETGERQLMGIYHSHPNGIPYPSETDRVMVYEPELVWIIITVKEMRAFRFIEEKQDFKEIEIQVKL